MVLTKQEVLVKQQILPVVLDSNDTVLVEENGVDKTESSCEGANRLFLISATLIWLKRLMLIKQRC